MAEVIIMGWDETNGVPARVKVTSDGKLIINPTGFLENPPTEDEDKKAPTSEWAFDHVANAAAHHARYTDAEACAAWPNRSKIITQGTYQPLDMENYNVGYARPYTANVVIAGIKGGYDGQIVYIFKDNKNKTLQMLHNYNPGSGGSKIITYSADHETIGDGKYGGFIMVFHSDYWYLYTMLPSLHEAHWADVAAHHAKYTDAEALAAPSNNTVTLTAGTYLAQSVDGKAIVWLDTTSGDIQIEGLADGYVGQMLTFVRLTSANNVILKYNSGTGGVDEKIYTKSRGDETQGGGYYGAFRMIKHTAAWWVDKDISQA